MKSRKTLLTLTAAALVTAACGGSEDTGTAEPPAPTTTAVSPGETTDQQQPGHTILDITIEGGQVEPTNAQLQANVGEPIVLRVDSDAADELHVHSSPEHTFGIEPRPGQVFQFTVDVPGQVDVELHELSKTVATIQVQP